MFWIVQENLFNELEFAELMEILVRADIPHAIVKIIPFTRELSGLPCDPPQPCIVYGSTSLTKIAKERQWMPGSFYGPNFDAQVWMPHYGEFCLNHNGSFHRFADVPRQYIPFFIRPVLDDKSFNGEVYETWDEFKDWQHKVLDLKETYTTLDADTMVMVAPWEKIIAEYRHFIVDGEIITSSRYKRLGRLSKDGLVDEYVKDFARQMVQRWVPDRAFCLDTAIMEDHSQRVVEINNINGAGLYHADVSKLVQALDGMKFSS